MLQITTARRNYVVDCLVTEVRGVLKQRLREVTQDQAVMKVMHGGVDDARCAHYRTKCRPGGFILQNPSTG